jgi:hypothetical protein
MAAIYSNGGNRWNILGFNFTKGDALPSVYKISMNMMCIFQVAKRDLMTLTYKLEGSFTS